MALARLPQVQRRTGRPYLEATSTLAACARKTCHQPHVRGFRRLQPPFQYHRRNLHVLLAAFLHFEFLYRDDDRGDLGVDISQHPLTRPVAAALAPSRRAVLGTAPSCSSRARLWPGTSTKLIP
jgi:hypothetical protein